MSTQADKDGGPAFPEHVLETDMRGLTHTRRVEIQRGMSLRDYFAAKVLGGIMSGSGAMRMEIQSFYGSMPSSSDSAMRLYARAAYEMADAMLAERAKET